MKIVILDRASLGPDTPVEKLRQFGELTIYENTAPAEICDRISDSDVIIINKIKITREILSSSKNLKLICIFATGYDNIDVKAAADCGVAVCNVPGYSSDSVALFTVAKVTALYTHLFEYSNFVSSGKYTESGIPNRLVPVYHEIAGKTWGIIGYGGIGKAVARIGEGFGAKILVNKRAPIDEVRCVDIDTLCRESDIITIHCPLSEETRGLISAEKIAMMKDGVVIVNEARGAVVVESDVCEAVLSGKIGGFGCDVYTSEPFPKEHPYSRIMNLENVIFTPHAAWGAYEARERCLDIIIENIKSFFGGKTLNRVDK